jgi:ATP-binding cassette subfamily B protein
MTTGEPAAGLRAVWARWRYLPRLVRLLWQLGRREVILIGTVSTLVGLVPILGLMILRSLVDSSVAVVTETGSSSTAAMWLAAFLLVVLLESVSQEVRDWISSDVLDRLKARVQERLISKAGGLPLATFERPDFYDDLHRSWESLESRVNNAFGQLFYLPSSAVMVFGLLVFMGTAHPLFPVVIAAGLVPLSIVQARIWARMFFVTRALSPLERRRSYFEELMTKREAAAEVHLFGLGEHLLGHRERITKHLRGEQLRVARENFTGRGTASVGEEVAVGLVIAGVAAMIAAARLSVGHFTAYLAAAQRL